LASLRNNWGEVEQKQVAPLARRCGGEAGTAFARSVKIRVGAHCCSEVEKCVVSLVSEKENPDHPQMLWVTL
jgi:hypothetical protein